MYSRSGSVAIVKAVPAPTGRRKTRPWPRRPGRGRRRGRRCSRVVACGSIALQRQVAVDRSPCRAGSAGRSGRAGRGRLGDGDGHRVLRRHPRVAARACRAAAGAGAAVCASGSFAQVCSRPGRTNQISVPPPRTKSQQLARPARVGPVGQHQHHHVRVGGDLPAVAHRQRPGRRLAFAGVHAQPHRAQRPGPARGWRSAVTTCRGGTWSRNDRDRAQASGSWSCSAASIRSQPRAGTCSGKRRRAWPDESRLAGCGGLCGRGLVVQRQHRHVHLPGVVGPAGDVHHRLGVGPRRRLRRVQRDPRDAGRARVVGVQVDQHHAARRAGRAVGGGTRASGSR